MSQFFYIHPDNPQARLINQAVEIVRKGGVIVYPTDSGYALGCKIEDKGGDGADLPHSSAAGRPQLYPDVPRSVRAVNLRFCG
ncbi:Sua5/YciO/YrdC/YwlC family protein [Klebsiella pneumoniae]